MAFFCVEPCLCGSLSCSTVSVVHFLLKRYFQSFNHLSAGGHLTPASCLLWIVLLWAQAHGSPGNCV